MTDDQLGQLLNLLIPVLLFLWRVLSSGRRNTPAATQERLTNGHATKRDTDEIRIYRERELLADRQTVEDLADLKRRQTFQDQRILEMQLQMMSYQRATEEAIRHLSEIINDCCHEHKIGTQTMLPAKPAAMLPPADLDLPKAS
jgi:hypothetical protein